MLDDLRYDEIVKVICLRYMLLHFPVKEELKLLICSLLKSQSGLAE